MDEQLDQFDAKLMAACHDVPVPAGLAERLLARLQSAGQGDRVETLAGNAISSSDAAHAVEVLPIAAADPGRPSRFARRKWMAASCAVAASLLMATFIAWQLWPRGDIIVSDALAREWHQMLSTRWSDLPAAGFSVPGYVAAPRGWQRFDKPAGHHGAAFDLTAPGTAKATLFVIDNRANDLRVDPAQPRPPTTPSSTGGGPSVGCWQSGQFVYVLVVEGTAEQYRQFINSVPQPVAQHDRIHTARAGASS